MSQTAKARAAAAKARLLAEGGKRITINLSADGMKNLARVRSLGQRGRKLSQTEAIERALEVY